MNLENDEYEHAKNLGPNPKTGSRTSSSPSSSFGLVASLSNETPQMIQELYTRFRRTMVCGTPAATPSRIVSKEESSHREGKRCDSVNGSNGDEESNRIPWAGNLRPRLHCLEATPPLACMSKETEVWLSSTALKQG